MSPHNKHDANTGPTPRPPTINGNSSLRIREKSHWFAPSCTREPFHHPSHPPHGDAQLRWVDPRFEKPQQKDKRVPKAVSILLFHCSPISTLSQWRLDSWRAALRPVHEHWKMSYSGSGSWPVYGLNWKHRKCRFLRHIHSAKFTEHRKWLGF